MGKLFVKQNIRVTNLTQGGLQGMAALADLEKERREGREKRGWLRMRCVRF